MRCGPDVAEVKDFTRSDKRAVSGYMNLEAGAIP